MSNKKQTKRQRAERCADARWLIPTHKLDADAIRFRVIFAWLDGYNAAVRDGAKKRRAAHKARFAYAQRMLELFGPIATETVKRRTEQADRYDYYRAHELSTTDSDETGRGAQDSAGASKLPKRANG